MYNRYYYNIKENIKERLSRFKEGNKETKELFEEPGYEFLKGLTVLMFSSLGLIVASGILYGLISLTSHTIESFKPRDIRWSNKTTLSKIAESVQSVDLDGDKVPELVVCMEGKKQIYKFNLEAYCKQDVNYYERVDSLTSKLTR